MEPNNNSIKANDLEPGGSVKGFIGGTQDQDCFRMSSKKAGILSGAVSGPAGVNLTVSLQVKTKNKPLVIDRKGTSGGETFKGVRLKPGKELLICLARADRGKPPAGKTAPGMEQEYQLKTVLSP